MLVYFLAMLLLVCLPFLHGREIPLPPKIIKQPPGGEIPFHVAIDGEDKPFSIECEAEGFPAPRYRWYKDGEVFDWKFDDDRIVQQPGRGTLVITKPRGVDAGRYECFAENEWGTAASNSIIMRKDEFKSFKTSPPVSVSGSEGKPFKLSCEAPNGWPKPKIFWVIQYPSGGFKSINNSRITVDPEGNLWFSNLTREDANDSDSLMYTCAASSITRFEYKLGIRVLLNVLANGIAPSSNKHEPVLQYVSRKNEVALRGKSVELFCIYGGTPLPQTVWLKNGKHIQFSDGIAQGNHGKSLIIQSVNFEDAGTYSCEVSNGIGKEQVYSINLVVLALPYFTEEPEFITAGEGETVEFRCIGSGVPKPQLKWIHNGRPIEEARPNPRRTVQVNSIVIEKVTKNDTGNYGCNATNSLGYIYKDVYINVLKMEAPVITEKPIDLEVVDAKNISMRCTVDGMPKPDVKWFHKDRVLIGDRYNVLENGDLHISNVQIEDSGDYTCYAQNKLGNATESCKLIVRAHTEIITFLEYYEVEVGSTAIIMCNPKSDSNVDVDITWLRDGHQIDFEEQPRFEKSSNYSLTISKANELDSGSYTCLAKTSLDQAETSSSLIVQDVPNPPSMRNVKCYTKVARINWLPLGDNRSPILRYIVEFNTSFVPNQWEIIDDQVPPVDMNYNVPISPWAIYSFRVTACNKLGCSDPSAPSDFCTTDPDVPYKNPDNVEIKSDQPNNLAINWTPMRQLEHNGPRFHYKIFWKQDKPGVEYQTHDIFDWKQHQTVIPNQPSSVQYRVKVVAENELGQANVSAKEVIGHVD